MSCTRKILVAFTSAFVMFAAAPAQAWTIKLDFNNRAVGDQVYSGSPSFSDAAGDTIVSDCAGFAEDGNCAQMSIPDDTRCGYHPPASAG